MIALLGLASFALIPISLVVLVVQLIRKKPWKRWLIIGSLSFLCLIVCLLADSQDEPSDLNKSRTTVPVETVLPDSTVTVTQETEGSIPETTFVIPQAVHYSGTGDDVLTISPPEGVYVFRINGNGDGKHFAVWGYDAEGNRTELFVNTTEPYSGVTLDPSLSTALLEITATGDWEIELVSIYEMPTIGQGDSIEGFGDSVMLISSHGLTASIVGNSVSAHFAVKSYGSSNYNLMVNTTEPYEGKVMIKGNPFILTVTSEDSWTITFDE